MSNQPKVSYQAPQHLEIRYTGNILGTLELLPRMGTVIKQERQAHPQMLLLDTGNFSGPNKPGPHQGKPHIEVMNALHYDAAVPGRAETKDSVALRQMGRSAKFPLVATNWKGMGEGNYFERVVKVKRGDLNIAILGLAWNEAPQDTEVIPAEKAVKEVLKDIDTDNTMVVVLSVLGYVADRALAMNNKCTMVILSGVNSPGFEEQMMVGNSLLIPVAPNAEFLGAVDLDLSGRVDVQKDK